MLVGDIYGGRDYASVGLSASTIACSFGKVVGADKALADYNPAGARAWRVRVCVCVVYEVVVCVACGDVRACARMHTHTHTVTHTHSDTHTQ
jgi:pantothenate kinase